MVQPNLFYLSVPNQWAILNFITFLGEALLRVLVKEFVLLPRSTAVVLGSSAK
jgi:hypothetical protein